MRRLFIIIALALLAAGHTAWWFSAASARKAAVDSHIAELNRRFAAAHSGSRFAYGEIAPAGWPLPPRIRLIGLTLTTTESAHAYRFTAPDVTIRSLGDDGYRLALPSGYTAEELQDGRILRSLRFETAPIPGLEVSADQKTPIPATAPLSVYRAELPAKERLIVHDGGKQATADFALPAILSRRPLPIPANLDRDADILFSLFEEIIARAN